MSDLYPISRKRMVGEAWFWITMTFVAVLVIGAVTFGLRWVLAEPRGALQARTQIQSGATRIAAYEHFFNLCAAVQGQEAAFAAQYDELTTATGDDEQRVRANIAGLSAQRGRSIAQYNVDARKDYTIGQFRASGLPFQIPATPYEKGVTTSCDA